MRFLIKLNKFYTLAAIDPPIISLIIATRITAPIIAIIIGTITGDYLMFYTINKSSKSNLPIAISLIHLAPIFSLFLVYFYFKKRLNIGSIIGIILVFIGTIIAIYYSHL